MDLKGVLLGFLTLGDQTGYELKQLMETSVGFFFGASFGSIYPTLKALEREGSVTVTEVIQSGRPNKKVYSLTSAGRRYLLQQLEEPLKDESFRSDFLIHLFFGHMKGPDAVLRWIERDRAYREARLGVLKQIEPTVRRHATPYQLLAWEFGVTYYESTLSWLAQAEQQVRSLSGADGTAAPGNHGSPDRPKGERTDSKRRGME